MKNILSILSSRKSCSDNFDSQGGRGKMFQLFGNEMNEIIAELNEVLAA
jgi:hypothetical protein